VAREQKDRNLIKKGRGNRSKHKCSKQTTEGRKGGERNERGSGREGSEKKGFWVGGKKSPL